MLHLLSAIKGGGIVTGYLFLGGMASMLAQVVLGNGTGVELGVVGALILVGFYVGVQLQKLKDCQKDLSKGQERLETELGKVKTDMSEVNTHLARIDMRLNIQQATSTVATDDNGQTYRKHHETP